MLPNPGDPARSIRSMRRPVLSWPLTAVLLAVLLAHLLLLQGMSFGESAGRTAPPAVPLLTAPLQVRQIELAAPRPVAATAMAAATPLVTSFVPPLATPPVAPTPVPVSHAPKRPLLTPPAAMAETEPTEPDPTPSAAEPRPAAPDGPSPPPALLLAAAAPSPRLAVPSAPPAPAASDASVPVYPTRLPPPVLLRYELRRGAISGAGELVWRPTEGRYQMAMEGKVFGINALGWASQGRLDAHGIAPERFVDRRRGRDAQAANFQRDKGLITYSGASDVHPLVPGAQDRLSFMLQLSAIVDAAPAKFGVGAQIALFVVGVRGAADVWTFTVESADTVNLPVGRVPGALHLRREPRKPYDTRAELWLDPARSHLPVRVRLSSAERDETTDFLLREVATP